jgi:hypothetical protein
MTVSQSSLLLNTNSQKSFTPAQKVKLSLKDVSYESLPTENLDKVVLSPRSNRILDSMGVALKDIVPPTLQQIQLEDPNLAKVYVQINKERRDKRRRSFYFFVRNSIFFFFFL